MHTCELLVVGSGGPRLLPRRVCGRWLAGCGRVAACQLVTVYTRGGAVREVEVKYRIRDAEALLAALKRRGIELGVPVRQDDQAYAPDGWVYGDARCGVPFARLRTVGGRHVFTVKPYSPGPGTGKVTWQPAVVNALASSAAGAGFGLSQDQDVLRAAGEPAELALCPLLRRVTVVEGQE